MEPFPADTQERIAYDSVAGIATQEPNDRARLGYHVWRWLKNRHGTLEEAVRESGARLSVPADAAVKAIRDHLASKGIGA